MKKNYKDLVNSPRFDVYITRILQRIREKGVMWTARHTQPRTYLMIVCDYLLCAGYLKFQKDTARYVEDFPKLPDGITKKELLGVFDDDNIKNIILETMRKHHPIWNVTSIIGVNFGHTDEAPEWMFRNLPMYSLFNQAMKNLVAEEKIYKSGYVQSNSYILPEKTDIIKKKFVDAIQKMRQTKDKRNTMLHAIAICSRILSVMDLENTYDVEISFSTVIQDTFLISYSMFLLDKTIRYGHLNFDLEKTYYSVSNIYSDGVADIYSKSRYTSFLDKIKSFTPRELLSLKQRSIPTTLEEIIAYET